MQIQFEYLTKKLIDWGGHNYIVHVWAKLKVTTSNTLQNLTKKLDVQVTEKKIRHTINGRRMHD